MKMKLTRSECLSLRDSLQKEREQVGDGRQVAAGTRIGAHQKEDGSDRDERQELVIELEVVHAEDRGDERANTRHERTTERSSRSDLSSGGIVLDGDTVSSATRHAGHYCGLLGTRFKKSKRRVF